MLKNYKYHYQYLSEEDIKYIFKCIIPVEHDEEIELTEIDTGSYGMRIKFIYKNKRVWNEYSVWIKDEMHTIIKSRSDNNVTRTRNNTIIADRVMFHIAAYLEDKSGVVLYPDIIEIKRLIKFLDRDALCYRLIENYFRIKFY